MAIISFVEDGEEADAAVLNRPLREALTALGLNPDGDITAPWLTQAGAAALFSALGHTHDDRYYTEAEADTLLSGKSGVGHTHAAADIASGTIATARLGSGTADNTKFLRGDQTWQVPAGGGGGSLSNIPMIFGRTAGVKIDLPASSVWATEIPAIFTVEFLVSIWNYQNFGGVFAFGTSGDGFIIHFANNGSVSFFGLSGQSAQLFLQREGRIRRISVVRNGASITYYADGVKIETITSGSGAGAVAIAGTPRMLMGDGGASEGMFNQALADVRVWSDVRTDAEIRDNAFKRMVGNEADLLAYWKMDEGTGTTINDSGPNNWDGTLNANGDWVELPLIGETA